MSGDSPGADPRGGRHDGRPFPRAAPGPPPTHTATPPAATMAKKGSKKASKKAAAAAKPMTKAEVISALAERTETDKRTAESFFDELESLIGEQLGKKGPGQFNVPGLMKIEVEHKEATPERTKANPFKKGETMTVKAKPAHNVVKIRPLKGMKDLVN